MKPQTEPQDIWKFLSDVSPPKRTTLNADFRAADVAAHAMRSDDGGLLDLVEA
jgi:hypothetical protein